ncbi:hypothetical protein KSP35_22905 [Aquihabitans sp. G128]|uniref:hypothetical protein n=1 Tax=Aquihabitans sp. G128 TaxID=2849779 RepID=UPI001C2439FE|nr:hypothetical protein [Aquihabitans sp. G128]QXC61125.1 hypothetical protein KSP35_22905 [Aquihabitans sp. G128]
MTTESPARPSTTSARRVRRRRVAAAVLAVVLAGGLAACGASGGDGAVGSGAGSGGSGASTTAPKGDRTGAVGGKGDDGGGKAKPDADTRVTTTTIDPREVDTEVGGKGDTDLPPAIDDDGTVVDGGGAGGGGAAPDGGGGGAGGDTGGDGGTGGGGTGRYPSKVINGIPLDMSQPFDVGREWAVAANYGDFATVDALSCANDKRAVEQGQQHQASLAALRQLVAVRWRARDATSGWLESTATSRCRPRSAPPSRRR